MHYYYSVGGMISAPGSDSGVGSSTPHLKLSRAHDTVVVLAGLALAHDRLCGHEVDRLRAVAHDIHAVHRLGPAAGSVFLVPHRRVDVTSVLVLLVGLVRLVPEGKQTQTVQHSASRVVYLRWRLRSGARCAMSCAVGEHKSGSSVCV